MKRLLTACFASLLVLSATFTVRGDVGEPASAEITRLQASKHFANVPSVHGWMPEQNLERWKFTTSNLEQQIFAIDARNYHSPVVREWYIHYTELNPYSMRPGQTTADGDIRDVLSPREYDDYRHAAFIGTVPEEPLHLDAHFYRGSIAAYETIEPTKRKYGSPDRFEWRAFPLSQLSAAMKAARSCNNGPDCAAW